MIATLLSEFWPQIIGGITFIAGFLGMYVKGRRDNNTKHKVRKAKADEKTHERINRVTPVDPVDRVDIDERLSKLRGRR